MVDIKKCPICGSSTTRQEADIVIGTMYGPAYCENCGWSEEEILSNIIFKPIEEVGNEP